jgi:DNA polymerase-3 subunit delta'
MFYPWHQKTWDQLVTMRDTKHLPHALLISGAEGTGRQAFAKTLVNSLLCESPREHYIACGQCKSCYVIASEVHPDYHQVVVAEDKTQIVVDQVRQLNEFLYMSRSYQGYRVVFIYPSEALNVNAANSLLKSLEEPADNTVIILLTSQLSTLLQTIKSRCQMLHLATPNQQLGLQWLSQQAPQHKPEELLAMAGGRPLYALTLDNEDHFKSRADFANDILAVVNQRQSITETSKKWQNASKQELLDWQLHWIQQLIRNHFSNVQQKPTLALLQSVDIAHLWVLHDQLIKFRRIAHTSLNSQLFIENLLLSWMKLL